MRCLEEFCFNAMLLGACHIAMWMVARVLCNVVFGLQFGPYLSAGFTAWCDIQIHTLAKPGGMQQVSNMICWKVHVGHKDVAVPDTLVDLLHQVDRVTFSLQLQGFYSLDFGFANPCNILVVPVDVIKGVV